ncbi:MAG: hypothetical protein ACR5KV_07670 [Wolbachia sp.]
MSRIDVPFLIAGAVAFLTLLTSGVFAVAPYVAFLSSVAALDERTKLTSDSEGKLSDLRERIDEISQKVIIL